MQNSASDLQGLAHEDPMVYLMILSVDSCKGTITGKTDISWENLWFFVSFPMKVNPLILLLFITEPGPAVAPPWLKPAPSWLEAPGAIAAPPGA